MNFFHQFLRGFNCLFFIVYYVRIFYGILSQKLKQDKLECFPLLKHTHDKFFNSQILRGFLLRNLQEFIIIVCKISFIF